MWKTSSSVTTGQTSGAISLVSEGVVSMHLPYWTMNRLPRWGAADAEIKVPYGEKTELKRSLFKAWSRLVYSHTCNINCQGFLPCLFLPFRPFTCIFFQTSPEFFLCKLWLTRGSCVGPQNKIGHLAGCRFPC